MGLVKCPDCNREVSESAPVCIHCGRPKPAEQPKKPDTAPPKRKKPKPDVVLTLLGGLLLAAALVSRIGGQAAQAGLGLRAGLGCVLLGALWGWLTRD